MKQKKTLFKKMTLRLRLTLLMGIVLTVACFIFSFASISSARDVYKDVHNEPNRTLIVYPISEVPALINITPDDEFAYKNIIIAVLIIVFGTGATYFLAGKALKPISLLNKEVETINESNLSLRVTIPPSNDEVATLAISFNKMITQIEKAFVMQKNFSANAAHELKTPLAGIINSIEVLFIDDILDPNECKEVLNDCLKNTERLSILINDLLELNRETCISLYETFDLYPILDSIIKELSSEIQAKNIVVTNIDTYFPIYGEKRLLIRIFHNLIYNAIKYNKPNGKIILSVTENDHEVSVSVHDTGIGIPNEELEKIFEPFYCVDKSRSRELGGSGLGLAIVKTIVEKHKGNIYVNSEQDVFTKVILSLPKK